jgi:zinc finger protein
MSNLKSLSAPLDDDRLTKEFYDRSFEQNEELGLNDMKTENYQLDTIDE